MADPSAIDQFIQFTNADAATARFFLSAANGDTDAAVSAFFDADGVIPPQAAPPAQPAVAPRPPPSTALPTTHPPPSAPSPMQAPASASSAPPPRRRAGSSSGGGSSSAGRIATLGSLERERDDDEKGYYAGGEKSGQMIQDPRKRGQNNNNPGASSSSRINSLNRPPANNPDDPAATGLADAILEQAQARSREPRAEEERAEFEGPQRFSGAGYRLGNTPEEGPARPTIIGRRNVTRVLTFYANGFRVDEGPLRRFDDPVNEAFLADVNRGVVPKEMEQPGVGDVSITLVDRKETEYEEKTPKVVPFSGGGNRLSANDDDALMSEQQDKAEKEGQGESRMPQVDESQPTARIQVRLVDGSRLVATLNTTQTVAQLRQFIRASRPNSPQSFNLATTFPRKVLSDATTIDEAKLNGAVVVQSLK